MVLHAQEPDLHEAGKASTGSPPAIPCERGMLRFGRPIGSRGEHAVYSKAAIQRGVVRRGATAASSTSARDEAG